MSTSDTIFLSTDLSLDQVVRHLVSELGLTETRSDDGTVYLARKNPADPGREVGGRMGTNPHFPVPDPEPDESSVIDGYDIAWDVSTVTKDEAVLHATTRSLFRDVVAAAPSWPALLTQQLDLLLAASRPETGMVEFPPGTTPDGDDRELWRPFDVWADRPANPRGA